MSEACEKAFSSIRIPISSSSSSGAPGVQAWDQISRDGQVTAGLSKTFTCSSSCSPDCVFSWSLKGLTVNGSSLTWTPDGRDNTLELQCNVLNPRTGASSSISSIVDIRSEYSWFIDVQVCRYGSS